MPRRSSSLHSIDDLIQRNISNDKYQDIVTVGQNVDNIAPVGANINDVLAVSAQVIPNLAEILLADDNAAAVTALYDQFDDRYLGSKAVAPTVDNDGDPLLVGALYWNSVSSALYVWSGTAWGTIMELVDNLISTDTTKALTANQGRVLKEFIDAFIATKGQIDGFTPLNGIGQIDAQYLPSYVDDVIEVATYAALPVTGETGLIYIVIADETSGNNTSTYRWTGTVYAQVSDTMTAADIKALYESNANTNAFTDILLSKLNGIEEGATADQTAAEIKTLYESNVDTNEFTDAEKQMLASGDSIGTILHSTTIQEKFNHTESAGVTEGADLTDNGNGTINLSAGECYIRAIDDSHSTLYVASFEAVTNLTLTDNAANIVYLDYNAGVPTFATGIDTSVVTITDKVPVYFIFRQGNVLHIRDIRSHNVDNTAKHQKHMFFTEREKYAYGAILSDAGTLHVALTASLFYFQLVPITSPAIDTSTTGTFSRYYRDGIGGFTEQTLQTTVDNTQYDDGTGTLVALGNGKFAVEWFYLVVDTSNSEFISVYGTNSYNTIAEAKAATAPGDIPAILGSFGVLVGRIISQEGNTEILAAESTFVDTFSSSLVQYHNNLAGLNIGDYQHLTAVEYANMLSSGDIGVTVQPYDATILNDADIGVTIQAYDATIVVDADIGVTVQGYDIDTVKYDVVGNFSSVQGSDITTAANAINFTTTNILRFTATAANITVGTMAVEKGKEYSVTIDSAENVTGWGTEFLFAPDFSAVTPTPPTMLGTMEFYMKIVEVNGVDGGTANKIHVAWA